MTGIREFLARIRVSAAFSWPTFWVAYVLNLAVTFVSALGGTAAWWQRVLAVSAAQLVMFAVVGLGALAERWVTSAAERGALALIWFALAGAARGATVSGLFITWGVQSESGEWARVGTGVAFGWVLLIPMSLVVGTARDYARTRAELLALQQRLAATAERKALQIDELEERSVERVRQGIVTAFTDAEIEETAHRLERVAVEIVRPMSHELARAVPAWQVPAGPVVVGRVRWRDVVERAASGRPLQPLATVLLITLLSFVAIVERIGLTLTLVSFALGIVMVSAVLAMANAVLGRLLRGDRLSRRVALVISVVFVAGLASGVGMVAIAWALGIGLTAAERVQLIAALVVVVPVFTLPLTVARAAREQLMTSLDELRAADETLLRRVARLGMVQWSQQRALARALHGPVQAVIAAGVNRIRRGEGLGATADELQAELLGLLDPKSRAGHRVSWTEGLLRVQATWEGMATIEIEESTAAQGALDADPVGADMVIETVSEAVSNAIRHGGATRIQGSVVLDAGDLLVSLRDDGTGPIARSEGLGSRLLDECTVRWELRAGPGGVVEFFAVLPMEAQEGVGAHRTA